MAVRHKTTAWAMDRLASDQEAGTAIATLPSDETMRAIKRTQSTITELLDQAQQQMQGKHPDDNWPGIAETSAQEDSPLTAQSRSTAKSILRLLLRKRQQVVRLAERKPASDVRFQRLQQGFARVRKHLTDTTTTRLRLKEALMAFRECAAAMQTVLPPEAPRDSRLMVTSLQPCFAQTSDLVDDLVHVLAHDIAHLTDTKIDQLDDFKEHLDRRRQLEVDCDIAKAQLAKFEKLAIKQRSAVPGAYQLELAQRKQEHQGLRQRLRETTSVVEQVLQFHALLDEIIVAPELHATHHQLTRFFEKHARVFENNAQ